MTTLRRDRSQKGVSNILHFHLLCSLVFDKSAVICPFVNPLEDYQIPAGPYAVLPDRAVGMAAPRAILPVCG